MSEYFCGEIDSQHQPPCVTNELSAFRKRVGKEGAQFLFDLSTVQSKNITYPTDSKQCVKMLSCLHKVILKENLNVRRSYVRELQTLRERLRYGHHSTKAKAANKARRRLKTIAGALLRDVERRLKAIDQLAAYEEIFALFHRFLEQKKNDKKKLYSFHEAHTQCIAKGKAHPKYEFGSIATVVRTLKSKIILGATCSTENRHDSKLLKEAIGSANANLKKPLKEVACDKGYRGSKEVEGAKVLIPGIKKYASGYSKSTLKRIFTKRAGVEATIGHLKSAFRLSKNDLKGVRGDHFNLLMACCAYNLKLWAKFAYFLCFLNFLRKKSFFEPKFA